MWNPRYQDESSAGFLLSKINRTVDQYNIDININSLSIAYNAIQFTSINAASRTRFMSKLALHNSINL